MKTAIYTHEHTRRCQTSQGGSDVSPAEVFSVCVFVKEEMEARGWTLEDLINHMPGNQDVNRLTLDIMFATPEFDDDIRKDMRLGEQTAIDLAQAFGTSKELWMNLDAAWATAAEKRSD